METWLCVIGIFLVSCSALPVDPDTPIGLPQTEKVGCLADVIEGKGDFKVEKTIYPVRNPGFYVESVKLLKRTSFYRCEPKAVKYGVTTDLYAWWVDKGCEGMFEVLECPDINKDPIPALPEQEMAKIEVNVIQAMDVPTTPFDVQKLELRGIENRFLYSAPGIVMLE